MYLQKMYSLLLLCGISIGAVSLRAAEEEVSPQKEAMELIQGIENAIHLTDGHAFKEFSRKLFKIDFRKTKAPLSLFIALCNAFIKPGREDFLTPSRKLLFSMLLKKVAEQAYMRLRIKKKYVMSKTKNEALEKIKELDKTSDPYLEVCGLTKHNLHCAMMILQAFPENNSALGKGFMILYHVLKVIYDGSEDSIAIVLKFFKDKAEGLYKGRLIEQMAAVWFLRSLILKGDRGNKEAFKKLLEIHHKTNSPRVMAETTTVLLTIVLDYYTPGNQKSAVTSEQAFVAFKTLLQTTQESRFKVMKNKWYAKNITVQGLLFLDGMIPGQNHIIKGYLHKIQQNEEEKPKSVFKKKKQTTKTQVLFESKEEIKKIVGEIQKVREYESNQEGSSLLKRLEEENNAQEETIEEVSKLLVATKKLIKQKMSDEESAK